MEIKGYETMIKGADSYFASAKKSFYKEGKFSNELVFNILTMAVEKYLVGLLMSKGVMPVNHVIKYLLTETEEYFTLDKTVHQHLEKVDEYLYICSLEDFTKKVPAKDELENILSALEKLKDFVHKHTEIDALAGQSLSK